MFQMKVGDTAKHTVKELKYLTENLRLNNLC